MVTWWNPCVFSSLMVVLPPLQLPRNCIELLERLERPVRACPRWRGVGLRAE
jgi:hypothetical protein